jgi:hypothetical protein
MLPLFLFILIFLVHTISSFRHIHSTHSSVANYRWGSFPSSHSKEAIWEKPPFWVPHRAVNWIRGFLTASQRTINWCMPHPLSYAAPFWATPHTFELRQNLLSYATFFSSTPHPTPKELYLFSFGHRPLNLQQNNLRIALVGVSSKSKIVAYYSNLWTCSAIIHCSCVYR